MEIIIKRKLTLILLFFGLLNLLLTLGCKDDSKKSEDTITTDTLDDKKEIEVNSSEEEKKYQNYLRITKGLYEKVTINNEIKYIQIHVPDDTPRKIASREEFFYILTLEDFISADIQGIKQEYIADIPPMKAFEEKCGKFPSSGTEHLKFLQCRDKALADLGPCIYVDFENKINEFESALVPSIFSEFSNEFKKHNRYLLQNLYYKIMEYRAKAQGDKSQNVSWTERLKIYNNLHIKPADIFRDAKPAGIDFEFPRISTFLYQDVIVYPHLIDYSRAEIANVGNCCTKFQDIKLIEFQSQ